MAKIEVAVVPNKETNKATLRAAGIEFVEKSAASIAVKFNAPRRVYFSAEALIADYKKQ